MNTRFLKGYEITPKEIKFIKRILKDNLTKEDYRENYSNIYNINDLSKYDEEPIEYERLVISNNWYLRYIISENYIFFLEWYSNKNKANMKRSIEMLNIIKNILLNNKDKYCIGNLIHTTSYRLYQLMIKKGLIEEISNHSNFIELSKKERKKFYQKLLLTFPNKNLDQILDNPKTKENEIFFEYIYHEVEFKPTENFLKKYEKKTQKN